MSKIYTKTGDKGQTSLFNKTRVFKDDIRVKAYGALDELNTIVGVVLSNIENEKVNEKVKNYLLKIQSDLFNIGSILANPAEGLKDEFLKILPEKVVEFEDFIDEMTQKMPELKNFILPGGSRAGSFLQLARSVSRRAEREVVTLLQKEEIAGEIIIYLNRLSDLFFTMSRFVNFKKNRKENIWRK